MLSRDEGKVILELACKILESVYKSIHVSSLTHSLKKCTIGFKTLKRTSKMTHPVAQLFGFPLIGQLFKASLFRSYEDDDGPGGIGGPSEVGAGPSTDEGGWSDPGPPDPDQSVGDPGLGGWGQDEATQGPLTGGLSDEPSSVGLGFGYGPGGHTQDYGSVFGSGLGLKDPADSDPGWAGLKLGFKSWAMGIKTFATIMGLTANPLAAGVTALTMAGLTAHRGAKALEPETKPKDTPLAVPTKTQPSTGQKAVETFTASSLTNPTRAWSQTYQNAAGTVVEPSKINYASVMSNYKKVLDESGSFYAAFKKYTQDQSGQVRKPAGRKPTSRKPTDPTYTAPAVPGSAQDLGLFQVKRAQRR